MAGDQVSYIPPPTIKAFIRDYRPGALFYSWIIGPVGCLPGDSEFLTPSGWKCMDEYVRGDQVAVYDCFGAIRFEQAGYVRLPAVEPFHVFDSGSLVMELSPEHRVLYDDYRGIRRTETAAKCAVHPGKRTILTTFNLFRSDAPIDDIEIRLRVAFSADGHTPPVTGGTSFTFREMCKMARLMHLLDMADTEWSKHMYDGRPEETIFRIERQTWTKSLDWVWALSQRQLAIVLEECLFWDGLVEHEEQWYFTSVKANADVIQFAVHACGRRATIESMAYPAHPNRATAYVVHIRTGDNSKNRAMICDETRMALRVSSDGFKYCFTTSTGYFIARCRNTIFVTGNSGKTTGNFFKLVYLARLQQPQADGIRRTRCVVIRNTAPQLKDTTIKSWFLWFKDGVAGTWRATDRDFTLRFADVEIEVMFRALDTDEDVARVLSLEVTFAIVDEFVQIQKAIIEALSGRLGRYPARKDGGATNWGMWGSSNPGTEDVWWYDYLHNRNEFAPSLSYHSAMLSAMDATGGARSANVQKIELFGSPERIAEAHRLLEAPPPDSNVRYFHQPPGDSPQVENIDNLPGERDYYVNQSKGKSTAWVEQFIRANWGFSASDTPVVKTFAPSIHVARGRLKYSMAHRLVIGFDPGVGGMAAVMGQEDLHGRLLVLGELTVQGMGVTRFMAERLKPYLRLFFPDADVLIAPDPASANRQQNDERAVVDVLKKHFPVSIETNNRLAKRLDAIESYTTRTTDVGPALLIDQEMCPRTIRALGGGWKYQKMTRKGDVMRPDPEKNEHSHVGDAVSYLARHFCRQYERTSERGQTLSSRSTVIGSFGRPVSYHFR